MFLNLPCYSVHRGQRGILHLYCIIHKILISGVPAWQTFKFSTVQHPRFSLRAACLSLLSSLSIRQIFSFEPALSPVISTRFLPASPFYAVRDPFRNLPMTSATSSSARPVFHRGFDRTLRGSSTNGARVTRSPHLHSTDRIKLAERFREERYTSEGMAGDPTRNILTARRGCLSPCFVEFAGRLMAGERKESRRRFL